MAKLDKEVKKISHNLVIAMTDFLKENDPYNGNDLNFTLSCVIGACSEYMAMIETFARNDGVSNDTDEQAIEGFVEIFKECLATKFTYVKSKEKEFRAAFEMANKPYIDIV